MSADHSRILLIDDDPIFRNLLVSSARARDLRVDAFDSLMEIEPFCKVQSYDGAILDFHLTGSSGVDVAANLKPFFVDIPVLLVSADPTARMKWASDTSIRSFIEKKEGCSRIVDEMIRLIENPEPAYATTASQDSLEISTRFPTFSARDWVRIALPFLSFHLHFW